MSPVMSAFPLGHRSESLKEHCGQISPIIQPVSLSGEGCKDHVEFQVNLPIRSRGGRFNSPTIPREGPVPEAGG